MKRCKKCGAHLMRHNTVKYKNTGGYKITGYHLFCPNRNCDYEEDES